MKISSEFISVLFHPVFLVFLLVTMAFAISPYDYAIADSKAGGAMHFMNFFLLVLFPLIGVSMLAGLKMISSIRLPKREDRIGPLLITLSFYIWYFINIKNNSSFPDTHRFVALGVTISVALAFFINNFSKISLHTLGAGSFATSLMLLIFYVNSSFVDIQIPLLGSYRLSSIFVLLFAVIMAGAVGSARLYLKAHSTQEIYGGYLVGIFAQIIAFRIYL